MRAADYIVDIGPSRLTWWTSGCVRHCRKIMQNPDSVTGGISERKNPDLVPRERRKTDRL